MMKKMLIRWFDSVGVTEKWEHLDEMDSLIPCECISIGFLIEDHVNYKTLVQTTSIDTGQILGRLTIPNGAIIETRELK
jgi:hypothetical protein